MADVIRLCSNSHLLLLSSLKTCTIPSYNKFTKVLSFTDSQFTFTHPTKHFDSFKFLSKKIACFTRIKKLFSSLKTCAIPTYKSFKRVLSFAASQIAFRQLTKHFDSLKVHAAIAETQQPKWWERSGGPNMIDIHSTQEFLNALSQAGERLVIVEFYGTWCASCRALFPKLCRTAGEHPEILFLKVNFDENKPMCKHLNVKVLPFFHFYRGADGQLESFSCSLVKFQKIKDAIAAHNTDRCSIGPPRGVGDINLEAVQ